MPPNAIEGEYHRDFGQIEDEMRFLPEIRYSFLPLMSPFLNKSAARLRKCKSTAARMHGDLAKIFLFACFAFLCQSCVKIRPATETATGRNGPSLSHTSGFIGQRNAPRVLMVGDSLTVGGFGDAMQGYLLGRLGSNNVAVYASCGSSPEHWMRSG